jgi:hypothetical protein
VLIKNSDIILSADNYEVSFRQKQMTVNSKGFLNNSLVKTNGLKKSEIFYFLPKTKFVCIFYFSKNMNE